MNLIMTTLACTTLSLLPLDAQAAPPATGPQAGSEAASQPAVDANSCNTKGCPEEDPHGHRPTQCSYEDGLATGFKCILLCNYSDSQWGTIVGSSACD